MKAQCPVCKQRITVTTRNVFRAHPPGRNHCPGSGQAVRTLTVPYSDANTKSDEERAGGSEVKDSFTDESKPKVDEDLLVNCNQEEKPADSDKTSRKDMEEARDKKCSTNWSGQPVPPPTDSAFDVITKSDEDKVERAGCSDVEGSDTVVSGWPGLLPYSEGGSGTVDVNRKRHTVASTETTTQPCLDSDAEGTTLKLKQEEPVIDTTSEFMWSEDFPPAIPKSKLEAKPDVDTKDVLAILEAKPDVD
eukprot:Em0003g1843a